MRLIDADILTEGIKKYFCNACSGPETGKCKACDIAEILSMIDDTPFYTSLENYIEEHGKEIDFMFFAPEIAEDGDNDD